VRSAFREGTARDRRAAAARQPPGETPARGWAFDGKYVQRRAAAAGFLNARGILPAIAVEQADGVAGTKAANDAEVMRLGALQNHQTRLQLRIDVESLGHPC